MLLIAQGAEALESRWAPSTLALTHLFTAGFMLQAMCGALLQFVPVAAGGNIKQPQLIAGLVHPCLCLAVLLFATAFLSGNYRWLDAAAILFMIGLGLYAYAVGSAIFRQVGSSSTIIGLRLAIVGLVITLILGTLLTQTLQGGIVLPVAQATNVHAAWGLVGWAGLLLIGVGYFVIPMFQMTPPYPQTLQKYLAPSLLTALVFWSLSMATGTPQALPSLGLLTILAGSTLFAITTLQIQSRRKRKLKDATLNFFRIAMACTIAAAIGTAILYWLPASDAYPGATVFVGILILHGVFGSAICGMLYKILPFALWMNLQKRDSSLTTKVNTRKLLGEVPMFRHAYLHLLALLVLLAATLLPILARPAGLLLVVAYGWLGWNLLEGLLNFRRYLPAADIARP